MRGDRTLSALIVAAAIVIALAWFGALLGWLIRMLAFAYPIQHRRWRRLRAVILRRDGYLCQWCGRPANSVDHLLPRALGGQHDPANLVAACRRCNAKRGARAAGFFNPPPGRRPPPVASPSPPDSPQFFVPPISGNVADYE